ncbi:MAG: hypothetical protein ACOX4J_08785 [Anaerovoracaceae bacterium]|jgi:flagellar assembly protein FliH
MISLSSIVKARSLHIYSGTESSAGAAKPHVNAKTPATPHINPERILEQAIKKSRHIHDEAVKRAEDLVKSAQEQGELIRMEAERLGYEEGYAKGLAEGAKEARRTAEEGLREIESLIEAIRRERMEAIKREEKDLLMVAFEIAKKIMKQQILIVENAIPKMLEEVIAENETGVKIFLPEYSKTLDVALDKSIAQKIRNLSKNVKVIVTQNDDHIMAETENGMVDMSIPVQLSQLREAMGLNEGLNE